MAESRSLRFAATARTLGDVARARGCVVPSFRSPPRVPATRSIRRHANGSATVSVVVRDRPWCAVVADMIDGFVAANPGIDQPHELRDALWGAIETIDLTDGHGATVTPLHRAA